VLFGAKAIYACPKASHLTVVEVQTHPTSIAGAMFEAPSRIESAPTAAPSTGGFNWRAQVVELQDLPPELTSDPDWPVHGSHRPVLVLKREQVTELRRARGSLIVKCGEESFVFRLRWFGRGKALDGVRALGWTL
jgi:hypothetical protein